MNIILFFKTIFLSEIAYPSIRNCPGAGRLSCMESFKSINSDAQLSTKLGTGILQDKYSFVYTERATVNFNFLYIFPQTLAHFPTSFSETFPKFL